MRHYVRFFCAAVHAALREWTGKADYERYARRCAADAEPALDRGAYFARRLEERYRTTSRCC